MYCVKCGVKLADTEKKCPLCDTVAYHPDVEQIDTPPLYPRGREPKMNAQSKAFNGIIILMFLLPMFVCLYADLQRNGTINWFGFAAGGLLVTYVIFALPLWFKKPNPIILMPVNFASVIIYLAYINWALDDKWFVSFALPVTASFGVIVCTVITLTCLLRRGYLYIFGGGFVALGGFIVMLELLLDMTFGVDFIGWSVYSMIALVMIGLGQIYLAINNTAREIMEQKLFF